MEELFGADPNIVGKTVRINKHPYTIVGVTPDGFYGTEKFLQSDIFVPMANQASLDGVNWLESRRQKMVFPIVRIKDRITLTQRPLGPSREWKLGQAFSAVTGTRRLGFSLHS